MNFEKEVIERSFDIPVVVDFWAAWCGPCQILGPVIEQLAEEQSDRWTLVKVDTEAYPELAERYRIRGIPNVKLFRNGEPVAEFSGALPKRAIEKWLDEELPSEDKQALTAILAQEGDFPNPVTQQALSEWVKAHPDDRVAALHLARYLVSSDPEKAAQLSQGFSPVDEEYQLCEAVQQLAGFVAADWIEEHPMATRLGGVQSNIQEGAWEEAAQGLIDAVQADKTFQGDTPRKTAIALFHLLGDAHPISKNYRWRFDMALY